MSDEKRPIDWELIERAPLTRAIDLYRTLRAPRGSESAIERICLVMCAKAAIWREMKWPAVTDINRQVKLGATIADIILSHVDGSFTIIEVKKAGLNIREYCTGVGQLCCQVVLAMSTFKTLRVRAVLALPGPVPPDIVLACFRANIEILPLQTEERWEESLALSG